MDRLWDSFVHALMALFVPLVCTYYALTANLFLNVSVENARGLEAVSNQLLAPVQYLLVGRIAKEQPDGTWKFSQRFDYTQSFWIKTAGSVVALPPSLVLGTLTKGASFLESSTRKRFQSLKKLHFASNLEHYQKMGLEIGAAPEFFPSQNHKRRPGDENNLKLEKEALREITALLNEAKIPWWVDCGTCIGAYRYGGIIPWDEDIDIAVFLPDFQNVQCALQKLDPKKYIVQDWSTRGSPQSYLKVSIRETGNLIDIYHYDIHPETKELRYIFSLDDHSFFPEWVKIRERRFTARVAFDTVFPLKKGTFDGLEVFLPNDPKKYLQRCYGENLDPAKVYDPETNRYEKDLSHPYWKNAYVH